MFFFNIDVTCISRWTEPVDGDDDDDVDDSCMGSFVITLRPIREPTISH